ncbi:hypothetical protein B0J18DRAFT_209400 [Chaetomium sp. MPI-SDFR-AT-0129]|nr:hypothetical protein B0J18DRAFT_209400 [Chaetomium sp. MPI-SDFR-AT-0129]
MSARERDLEEGCFAQTFERKYYHREGVFIKRNLRSNRIGGPSGLVIPPYRAMRKTETDNWHLQVSDHDEFIFCHNDLSQQNVIVDPGALKINAIIDWEYAGFYPEYFEMAFYTRLGPSVAIGDEVDDSEKLLDFLKSRSEGAV